MARISFAFGPLRMRRPVTPLSGPWTTSTRSPSWSSGHGSNRSSVSTRRWIASISSAAIGAGLPLKDTTDATPTHVSTSSDALGVEPGEAVARERAASRSASCGPSTATTEGRWAGKPRCACARAGPATTFSARERVHTANQGEATSMTGARGLPRRGRRRQAHAPGRLGARRGIRGSRCRAGILTSASNYR